MTTALPTAVMLSGLPNDEVKDVLATDSNLFTNDMFLLSLFKKANEPSTLPDSKSKENVRLSVQKVDGIRHDKDDNYYLKVADVMEKNLFGSISPPSKRVSDQSLVCDDGYHTGNDKNKNGVLWPTFKARPFSKSIATKCQESSEPTMDILSYVCDVIDTLEKKYEVLQEQQKPQEKSKELTIIYQDRDLLKLLDNIKNYKPFTFAAAPTESDGENRSVYSRLNQTEFQPFVLVPCPKRGVWCGYTEPVYF